MSTQIISSPGYILSQEEHVKRNKLKAGSLVRLAFNQWGSKDYGWGGPDSDDLSHFTDSEFKITAINRNYITIKFAHRSSKTFKVPYYALEPIPEKVRLADNREAVICDDGIRVGCLEVPLATLKLLVKKVEALK